MHENYFDNAATTPVDPRVVAEMLPYLTETPGNAASIHQYGQHARRAVKLARQRCAELIGAEDPMQITFCSGSSEANNWVLHNYAGKRVAVSPHEHPSIARKASSENFTILPPYDQALPAGFDLLAQMWVNNEVGTIFDLDALKARTQSERILVDGTQGIGKLPFGVGDHDYVSVSAHKLYGPKGIGFLYQRSIDLSPLLFGGDQEFARRGGTVNVPGVVALGAACAIAADELESRQAHARQLNAIVREGLLPIPDVHVNSSPDASPYILSVSFAGLVGEALLIDLDRQGFCCSAGSACSSEHSDASPALISFGIPERWIAGTIRISFGQYNTPESSANLVRAIAASVDKIRCLR